MTLTEDELKQLAEKRREQWETSADKFIASLMRRPLTQNQCNTLRAILITNERKLEADKSRAELDQLSTALYGDQ